MPVSSVVLGWMACWAGATFRARARIASKAAHFTRDRKMVSSGKDA